MRWKPFTPGTPYTCNDCPALAEVRAERDRWQTIAHCRSCEPLDDYYCTKHRPEEADEVDRA